MNAHESSPWALVLAAGEGSRLRSLTTDVAGVAVPKQFCSVGTGESLLGASLARARRVATPDRIVTVVAAEHERWWRLEVAELPAANVIVQPRNRGTAAGILLPLLAIHRRDPEARIAILPADHFVRSEHVLAATIRRAFVALARGDSRAVLLGITPDAAEGDYGWITAADRLEDAARPIASFVEKPGPEVAGRLFAEGAVWNSFVFATTSRGLLELYAERLPDLLESFRSVAKRAATTDELAEIYERLPAEDFSGRLLQGSEASLAVIRAPACGWTDLGTPARLIACLEELSTRARSRRRKQSSGRASLDLLAVIARRPAGWAEAPHAPSRAHRSATASSAA